MGADIIRARAFPYLVYVALSFIFLTEKDSRLFSFLSPLILSCAGAGEHLLEDGCDAPLRALERDVLLPQARKLVVPHAHLLPQLPQLRCETPCASLSSAAAPAPLVAALARSTRRRLTLGILRAALAAAARGFGAAGVRRREQDSEPSPPPHEHLLMVLARGGPRRGWRKLARRRKHRKVERVHPPLVVHAAPTRLARARDVLRPRRVPHPARRLAHELLELA
mmetsp:Transcript_5168/g.18055  ORF Transcript_5168/g.18055 Transcript_5168/m.18055 type:complete len:224 (+) Transcript_5168:729-1400(+)